MMRSNMSQQVGTPGMVRRPMVAAPMRMKKGGTVTPKGNGCCAKSKPCKMS